MHQERHKHDTEQKTAKTRLKNLEAERYDIFRQISKQTTIDDHIGRFDKDLTELQALTNSKINEIDEFVYQKQKSRNLISDDSKDADKEIDGDIAQFYSKRNILYRSMTECPHCKERFYDSIFHDHISVCSIISKRVAQNDRKSLVENLTNDEISVPYDPVKPKPPRNLRIRSVDFSSITIEWDKSIFDGGEPIIDYEVIYCVHSDPKQTSERSARTEFSESCSRWCLAKPIPDNSYTIEGLSAGTKCSNIKLRCKNNVGWSGFGRRIKDTKTAEPIRPSIPQSFSISHIASSSMHLEWSPPLHCGGSTLEGYILSFFEPVDCETQYAGEKQKQVTMREKFITLSHEQISFDLQDLKGDTLYKDFQLIATTKCGLKSDAIQHPDVRTNPPSTLHSLQKEIEWVHLSSETFVDSDFFQPGVMQRERKTSYLKKLKGELSKLQNDTHKSTNEKADKGTLRNYEDEIIDSVASEITDRREQNFHFRIKALISEINECEASIERNLTARASLSRKLAQIQSNVKSLRQELRRISEIEDEYVNSRTLHTAEQKFRTVDLRAALQRKISEELLLIETWKTDMIERDDSNSKLTTLIEKKEDLLRDRKAALLIFKKQRDSSSHLRMQTSREKIDILRHNFTTWQSTTKNIRDGRNTIQHLLSLRSHLVVRKAFSVLKTNTQTQLKMQTLMKGKTNIKSKGGMLLLNTELASINISDDIKSAMKDLQRHDKDRNGASELDETNFSLIRGDYYFRLEEYEDARGCYKCALDIALANENEGKERNPILCEIMDKIGRSSIKMGSLNEAVLNYDSLRQLGNELNDERCKMVASVGLGDCYIQTGDLVIAKQNYLQSLSHNIQNKHDDVVELAKKGIRACENKTEGSSPDNKSQENDLDCKIFDTIRGAYDTSKRIQDQITKQTTVAGYNIKIEQVSCAYVKARNLATQLNEECGQKEELLSDIRNDIERLTKLISNIEVELATPLDGRTGKSTRVSELVHDNAQNFDENELLERLKIRLKESTEDQQKAKHQEKVLATQIRNIQDELDTIQENLRLEESEVMQKHIKKRSIRLMKFDRLFISEDCDESTQSQHLLIAVTIDKDLYIHDAFSGTALQAFEGDTASDNTNETTGHTSTITSLHYEGTLVFTGSMDRTVRCWDLTSNNLQYIAKGHTSTVTSICTTTSSICSGSADKSIIHWDKKTGQQLHLLIGHSRGILSLHNAGLGGIISGDGDGDIFIWDENLSVSHRLELQPLTRVTVIRSGQLEMICGDHSGFISIFWLKTDSITQQCKAHETSVVDLEFDVTKIVSCGMDGCVKVIDITSFEIIHTIRGENGPILSCCFDDDKIMTLTKDGRVRHWLWQSAVDPHQNGEKYHRVISGDTVASIAKFYKTTVVNLIKWNINQDMKNIEIGQRLVVEKLDPAKTASLDTNNDAAMTSASSFRPSTKSHVNGESEGVHCEPALVASRLARSSNY